MRRIHFVPALLAATLIAIGHAAPAAAVQSDLTIFIDFDNDPATGCNDVASGFQGYDQKVVTTVNTTTGPNAATVTHIEGRDCSNTLVFSDNTPHPVGIGNGDLGFNVVETYWPVVSMTPPPLHPCHGAAGINCLRLGVYAENANGGSDTLFTSDGAAAGPSIVFLLGGGQDIPTLSEWGLLALVLLLAGVAMFKLRRRPLRAVLTVLLVLCAGGVAFAVLGDLDGNTLQEWNPSTRVAFDPNAQNDGDDIASLYARHGAPPDRVYFRIDASLVFNTAPVVTPTPGATTFTEDGPAVVVDNGITVTDADSANLASATVAITNPQDGALETLAASACAGLTVTPGLNSLSITGSAPPATYQTCFRSVTYNNTSNTPGTTPRTVAFVANDGITNGAPGNKTVNVVPNNDAPVVTTTAGNTAFAEDGGPVVVDNGVSVSDVDSANLASATVTITNPQDGASEVLAATACAGLTVTPGLNTLSITGSQSLATYQTCLRSVTFDDTSNNPNTTNRTLSFVVNDGALASAPANKTVTVAPSPDAPVVTTTGGSTSFTEDGGAVVVDAGVTVTDPDDANLASATVTITNPQDGASEVLAASACAGLTVTPGLNTLSITGSQPLATYQTCLQSVTYNDTDQDPGTTARVITFVASDGTNSSAPANKTVTVTPVNDAPVVTTTAGTTAFTEDSGPVVVDSGVTVTDVDNANLASATVTITNPQDGASEVLAATSCAGITVTPGVNTLALNGSATLAAYQTCLQSVTYNNTDQDPETATTRVVSFVANDGTASSAAANKNVSVGAVNDAPVVTTTAGSTAFTEDGGAVVVDSGLTVTDADSANLASATVTITNPQDGAAEVLAATSCGGLTVTPGLNTLSISGSATVAAYQTCLRSVTYNNTDQDPGTTARVLSFVANDGTNASAPANKTVTVAAANDAPVVTTTGGSTAFTEDGGAVVVDSGVTVTDVDNANLASATVTITNPQDGAAEVLAATSCAGITVTPGLNTLSLSGSATVAAYQTCLRSVTYNNTDQDPGTTARVLSFVANDGTASSAPANKTVTVAAVNDAPVVTTTGGSSSFTEGAGAVVVDSGVTVTDADSANLASATVTITNPQDGALEVLAATSCAGLTVTPGLNSLSITGSQPLATYQTCLQSVTYNNTDLDPDTTARVISFVANDGALSSTPATKTVTVTAVNSAPVVTTTAGTTAFVEDAGAVVVDSGLTVTDVDSANLASATVTITNPQDGALETLGATSCAGLTVTPGLNSLSINGSQPPATYQTCLRSVTFNDASDTPNTTTRVISFVANDGAASSAPANKNVSVTGANDAPIVATTAGSTSFTEDGGAVVIDSGVTVVDADSPNLASATVTITNPQDGALETLAANSPATNCTGLTVTPGLNNLSITGSATPAAYQTCLRNVTFNDSSQNPGTTTRVISFVANDGALSSTPATKNVTVTPVNDAPVVTTSGGTTAFVEDAGAVAIDSALTVTDADSANLASATVTITNPQDGAAEVLAGPSCGGLTVTPGLNTLAISGSATVASYQTCLRSVTYNNSSNNPNSTVRVISFVANDGALSSAPANKNVSVTGVNDAPVVTTTGGNTSFTEDAGAVVVDSGVTVSDVDNANLASATVTITNPQDGALEVLAATSCAGLTVTPGLNSLAISGSQPLATYQTCLQSVTYNNSDQDPAGAPNRIVRFVVNDGTSNSNNGDKTVTVTPVNDAPVVTTSGGITSFTEDGGAVVVDNALTVTDVDNANLASATVTITNVLDPTFESLAATSCAGLTVTGGGTTALSITGSQPKATYQTCLRSVTYNNLDQDPNATTRIIRFVVNDGALNSNNGDKQVSVTPVNDAPALTTNPVTYATAGNTQLHVEGKTLPGVAATTDAQGVDAKAGPFTDPDGPAAPAIVDAAGATVNGGSYDLDPDGSFTYVPPVGFTGTDSFTYQVTDTVAFTTGTVNITVSAPVVWYIRDVIDAANPAAGDTGRSNNPFDSISEFNAATTANGDIIYVFEGNTGTTPHSGSITLKDGQKLWGQGVDLDHPNFANLVTATNKARIQSTAASTNTVNVPATAGNRQNVEIRGLDLEATGATSNAIDVTESGANIIGVTISNDTIRGATSEGIDVNHNGTSATSTLALANNVLTATGAAADIAAPTGTLTITAFNDNVVTGTSVGGIAVSGGANPVIFDAAATAGIQPVPGGTTTIGTAADRIGGPGLTLNNVTGALNFANAAAPPIGAGDLDIFTDSGAALTVTGGTGGFDFDVTNNAGTLVANAGPAAVLSTADVSLTLASLTSTTTTSAVSLTTVSGTFSAPAGSAITKSSGAGTAFSVASSSATVSYAGTLNVSSGSGVSLTTNTGTTTFSGGMTLSTGSNSGFSATGGGTVVVTDPAGPANNTITTTSGTPLTVNGTTIGASGLTFESISAGTSGSPANGIFLSNTGNGVLTVTGDGTTTSLGGNSSGGTIQNTTGATGSTSGIGVYVNNARATLRRMNIHDHSNYGVFGGGTTIFNLEYSTVNSTATATSTIGDSGAADDEEGAVAFEEWAGSGTILSCIIGDGFANNLRVLNTNGADLNRLTVTSSRFDFNGQTAGNDQVHLESRNSGTTLNFTMTGTTVKGARADWFNASANSSSVMDTILTGNTFTNITPDNHPATVANGNRVLITANATHTFDIENNTLKGSFGNALAVTGAAGGAVLTGKLINNDIGDAAIANSGSTGAGGISIQSGAGADITVMIDGNDVRQYNNHGIIFTLGDQMGNAATINATVQNNTANTPGTLLTDFNGFHVNSGTVSTDSLTSCLNIHDNNFTGGGKGSVAPNNSDVRLRQRQGTTVQLPGYTGPARDNGDLDVAEVITYLRPAGSGGLKNNTFSTGNANSVSTGGGYTNSPGGAACATPP